MVHRGYPIGITDLQRIAMQVAELGAIWRQMCFDDCTAVVRTRDLLYSFSKHHSC